MEINMESPHHALHALSHSPDVTVEGIHDGEVHGDCVYDKGDQHNRPDSEKDFKRPA